MFKIKSADQKAKTLKRIRQFENDIENIRQKKGAEAAAWFRKTYQAQVLEFKQQVERYEALKNYGAPPFRDADLRKLGSYLVDARIAAGLTQTQLAEKLGVSQPMVFKYENAEYAGFGLDVIERAIEALDLNVNVGAEKKIHMASKKTEHTTEIPLGLLSRWAGDAYFRDHILRGAHV